MLKVWFPGTDDIEDYGLGNSQWVNDNVTISNNGKLGKCLSFNGSNSRLSTTNFNLSNEWSFCFWAKCNNASSGWMALWALGDNNDSNVTAGYFLIPTQSRSQISFNGTYNSGLSLPSSTEWTHYAGSWDGTKLIYYINGTQVYQNTYTTTYLQKTHLTIGGESNDSTDGGHGAIRIPFNGLINDFRIYDDYILSPREVKQVSTALVLHYPLAMPGQENLLSVQISDNHWTNWGSSAWNTNNTREKILGDDGRTWVHIVQNTSDGYGGYACNPDNNLIVIDSSKRYTWSCIAKSGTKENAEIVLWCHWRSTEGGANLSQNTKKFQLTSNPQRISWTLPQYTNATYTVNRINLMMGTYGTGNNEIYFTDVKFEEGEIATPWIPNPADPAYNALGFNDGIEYDVSGYQHNGTKVGSITYDADTPRYNTSAYFNGSSDIRSAKSSFGWFDFKEGTVAAWFKPANTTQTWASVGVQNDGGTGSRSFSVCNYSGKAGTVVGYDSSWGYLASDFSMAANTWYHLCATITNGDTVKLYVNGELVQTRTVTNTTGTIASTTQFAVGVDLPGSDERFTGQLSDVRFYTTCLNESDVRELYNTSMSLSNNGVLFGYEFIE